MTDYSEEDLKLFKEWMESRPRKIRTVLEQHFNPPALCYRLSNDPNHRGHYAFYSIYERDDGKVLLTIAHGKDSFSPGLRVFGISPEEMVPCNCGKWEPPTQEQIDDIPNIIERTKIMMEVTNAITKAVLDTADKDKPQ